MFNTIKDMDGSDSFSDTGFAGAGYDKKDIELYLDELEAAQIQERFHGGINCNVKQAPHGRLYKIKRQRNVDNRTMGKHWGVTSYE